MQAHRTRNAWLWLVLALAVHVADEALTGFLGVYNPTVGVIRTRLGWFPLPQFRFDVWLTGLGALIVGLLLLTPLVARGRRGVVVPATAFAGLMMLNGLGHIAGSILGHTVTEVRFERPMPGFWSSPALIAAALHFVVRATRSPAPAGARPGSASAVS